MTVPRRLLDGAGDAYTRELLASAAVDEPDERVLPRLMAGVTGAGVTTAAAAHAVASTATGGTAALGAVAAAGKASGAVVIVKWIGIGAFCGLTTAGGAHYLATRASRPPAGVNAASEPQPKAALPPAGPQPAVAERRAVPSEQPQSAGALPAKQTATHAPARARGNASTIAAPPMPAPNPLAAEVAALDTARRALARGDTAAALRALDAYASSRRTGVLEREATIVRIDALVARGEKARAVKLARQYIARFPGDAHAGRLKKLISDAE